MPIDLIDVEKQVRQRFELAKESLVILEKSFEMSEKALTDAIPGYSAMTLEYGSYDQDNFSVLFADMRSSTDRAKAIGPNKTFLSMHAFIPALLCTVEHHGGYVIDIMGDGIMVFFGGRHSGIAKTIAAQKAGLCGMDMIKVVDQVVNKILDENEIYWKINIGVGVDYGNVIVTKIGTDQNFDTKAFGDCINKAAKYASNKENNMKVLVSKQIKDLWPSGENGLMRFSMHGDGYQLYKHG